MTAEQITIDSSLAGILGVFVLLLLILWLLKQLLR
jgi:hypothetical protein